MIRKLIGAMIWWAIRDRVLSEIVETGAPNEREAAVEFNKFQADFTSHLERVQRELEAGARTPLRAVGRAPNSGSAA